MNAPKIIGTRNNKLVLQTGNQEQELPLDWNALQTELGRQGITSFQYAEKIYNIGEIGTANFNILVQQLPHVFKKFLTPTGASVPSTFLGRKEELSEVRKRLATGNTLALINGEGGIGKTTLAVKYWEQYKEQYQHLAWLFCQNNIIDQLVSQLAFPLGIDLKQFNNREEQINALRSEMGNLPKDCLIILDNANEEDHITEFLQEFQGLGWHILFTSRCQKVVQNEYYINGLPAPLAQRHFKISFVSVFEFEKILSLFEAYNQNNISESNFESEIDALFAKHAPNIARELPNQLSQFLEAVGYNTLVIEIFAKGLAEFSSTGKGFADFLKRLEEKGGLKLENDENNQYAFRIFTNYTLNVKKRGATSDEIIEILYDLSGLKKNEIDRLTGNALLPAENIDLPTLSELFSIDAMDMKAELDNLTRKGWIFTDMKSYRVSPVVQQIVLKKNEERLWGCGDVLVGSLHYKMQYDGSTIQFKNISYNEINSYVIRTSFLIDKLYEYVYMKKDNYDVFLLKFASLMEKLFNIFDILGRYNDKIMIMKKIDNVTLELNKIYPESLIGYKMLQLRTILYSKKEEANNNLHKAIEYALDAYEMAYASYEYDKNSIDDVISVGVSAERLGVLYREIPDFDNAMLYFKKYYDFSQEMMALLPEDRSKNNLALANQFIGDVYEKKGDFKNALKYAQEYNRIMKEIYESQPKSSDYKNNYAISYEKMGLAEFNLNNYGRAIEYFEIYLSLEKELQNEYPDYVKFNKGLALAYEKMGILFSKMGKCTEAISYFKNQIDVLEKLIDSNPYEAKLYNYIMKACENIVMNYSVENKHTEARINFLKLENYNNIFEDKFYREKYSLIISEKENIDIIIKSRYSQLNIFIQDKLDKSNALERAEYYISLLENSMLQEFLKDSIENLLDGEQNLFFLQYENEEYKLSYIKYQVLISEYYNKINDFDNYKSYTILINRDLKTYFKLEENIKLYFKEVYAQTCYDLAVIYLNNKNTLVAKNKLKLSIKYWEIVLKEGGYNSEIIEKLNKSKELLDKMPNFFMALINDIILQDILNFIKYLNR